MRVLPVVTGLGLLCACATPAGAQEGPRLDRVVITGNQRVEEEAIRVQLRSQAGVAGGLAQLSTQDLTALVANQNARNDQLRGEVSSLERELGTLNQNAARGEVSVDELRAELSRIRAYAGLGVNHLALTFESRDPDGLAHEMEAFFREVVPLVPAI